MKRPKQGSYRTKMRDHMLEIANRIISAEGLAAVQARRVAQEAGCAVGTLYNVFGGLDLLIIEANARTLDALRDKLARANEAASAAPMSDRLLGLALEYLEFASTHDKSWRAVFDHQMAPGAEVPSWYRERQGTLFALVETVLENTIADVALRASNARALFAAVHGIVVISLDSKLGNFDYGETQRQVRFVVGSVANGLIAQSAA